MCSKVPALRNYLKSQIDDVKFQIKTVNERYLIALNEIERLRRAYDAKRDFVKMEYGKENLDMQEFGQKFLLFMKDSAHATYDEQTDRFKELCT